MAENIQNERLLRKERIGNIRDILQRDVTDENIRRYIFGSEDLEDAIVNTNNYVQYIKNVLSLTFYFSYACYRFDMDEGGNITEKLTKHNSRRIIKSMRDAFVRYPVTQELIQFILTDIQFDLAQGGELKKVFGNLCRGDMEEFSFNPYFKLIAEYNKNPSRFQYSRLELLRLFEELLDTLTFLGDYQLTQDDADLFRFVRKSYVRVKDEYKELMLNHIFFRDDAHYFGGIYHLFSIETQGNDLQSDPQNKTQEKPAPVILRYFTPSGDRSITFSLAAEESEEEDTDSHLRGQRPHEVFLEVTGQKQVRQTQARAAAKNSNSIDQVHTINYKYIKNLALAISDAISANDGSKKALYNRFYPMCPYVFDQLSHGKSAGDSTVRPYEDKNLDWDTIVIMLLIEASPSLVMEHLFWKVPQTFFSVTRNLYRRIFDVENLAIFSGDDESVLNAETDRIVKEKLILGEAGGFGKIPTRSVSERLRARARVMLILSKLTSLEEDESDENLIYTGNLRSNISLLQKTNTEEDTEKRIKYACIILGETLRHIMCFYSGILEYGKAKAVYDNLVFDRCLSKAEISKHQQNLESRFFAAARQEAAQLVSCTSTTPAETLALFEKFIAFCQKCNPENNVLSDTARQLYTAVGKYEMVNMSVLTREYDALRASCPDAYQCDADRWVASTLRILEYFKTGSFSNTPIDHNLFNTIYPFTAVFNRGKENSDGYKTVNFTLNLDIDDDNTNDYQADVNVLSEFSFVRSDVYYCLPNIIRSNYKWWIDPILINFKEFNDIFTEVRKEDS